MKKMFLVATVGLFAFASFAQELKHFKPFKPADQQETPAVAAAKTDLCQRLDIDEKRIKDFGWEALGSVVTTSWPVSSSITRLRIGLVYKRTTYIYDGHDFYNGETGEWTGDAEFTGITIPTVYDEKHNLILTP